MTNRRTAHKGRSNHTERHFNQSYQRSHASGQLLKYINCKEKVVWYHLLIPLLQYILIFLRQGNYRHELMIMVALSMVITQVGLLLFIKDLYWILWRWSFLKLLVGTFGATVRPSGECFTYKIIYQFKIKHRICFIKDE